MEGNGGQKTPPTFITPVMGATFFAYDGPTTAKRVVVAEEQEEEEEEEEEDRLVATVGGAGGRDDAREAYIKKQM